jgi:heme exporter protein C
MNTVSATPRIGLFWFSSPQTFFPLAGRMVPLFAALAAGLALIGLWIAFFVAPTDATQGESYRIIFIHVPSAWMSMFLYVVMAFWAAVGLIFNTRLSSMMATAIAPTGALMTFLALWTGSLWGRPTWGTYWVTIRGEPTRRARCWRWSASSTSRSSISRCSGGTRCTRGRRSA